MFKLETRRLVIRDMTLDDEDAFVGMSQDPKYQRFMMKLIVNLASIEN